MTRIRIQSVTPTIKLQSGCFDGYCLMRALITRTLWRASPLLNARQDIGYTGNANRRKVLAMPLRDYQLIAVDDCREAIRRAGSACVLVMPHRFSGKIRRGRRDCAIWHRH